MLVLTRRVGERILVGNDVTITVVAVDGGKIRIGVEAPQHLRVDREEVRKAQDYRGGIPKGQTT